VKKMSSSLAVIVTGLGMIYFVIVARVMGIFTWRSGWESHAVTEADQPGRFHFAIIVTSVIAGAFIVWGLLRLMKR
jgi:hypothetical protein